MKKLASLAAAILLAGAVSGCKSTLHEGENYVRGKSVGFDFVGLMTVVPNSYSDAVKDLHANVDKQGKSDIKLVNYNVSYSGPYYLLFSLPTITLEAEKVPLKESEMKYVNSNVIGVDRGFKFLGFFDFVPLSFNSALNDLYSKQSVAPDKKVLLTNLTMEDSSLYFLLFSVTKLTIRGDLIQADKADGTPIPVAAPAAKAPVKAAEPAAKETAKKSGVK